MKMTEMRFVPVATLEFTKDDVERLIRCSERHYDSKCQRLSKGGGLLFGLRNWMEVDGRESLDRTLDFGDIDTLAKVTELDAPDLSAAFSAILRQMNDEAGRVNGG